MRHEHQLPEHPRKGQEATCSESGCIMPMIFDGSRWRWYYDIDPAKRRKLQRIFIIDQMTSDA